MSKGRIVQTIVEYIALLGWFALAAVNPIVAAVVLVAGLTLEHVVAFNASNARSLFKFGSIGHLATLLVLSALEAGLWVQWLRFINDSQPVVAFAFLAGGLIIQHALEVSYNATRNVFKTFGRAFGKVPLISIIEGASAAGWVGLGGIVGKVILAGGLLIEHGLQGKIIKELGE